VRIKTIPISYIEWKPAWRIIPTRLPTIDIFEDIALKEDRVALNELESMTNDRLRNEKREISLTKTDETLKGPGSSFIMKPFTTLRPGRFNDGSFGVFYAAYDLPTAIEETRYHREKFMRATMEKTMFLEMAALNFDIEGDFHDLRNKTKRSKIYDPNDYSTGQKLGRVLKDNNSNGIVYHSVRREEGECIGVFHPTLISNQRHNQYFLYYWGSQEQAIIGIYEVNRIY